MTYRTTIIFGTMKYDNLSINTLASNNFIMTIYRNFFQYGVKTYSKMFNHFCQKYFVLYGFIKNSPACGSNAYQIMYRDFRLTMLASLYGNIKCPIGKSIFLVNLPLKLFCATVANADAGSQHLTS